MKSDFTFAKDDTHRFLPWHIGIMVALATFLLSLVISLSQWAGEHRQDYAGTLSIIIPGTLEKLDDKTAKVIALVSRQKGITGVTPLGEAQLRELLVPWIGNGDALLDMPLPVVLDVSLQLGPDKPDIAHLKRELSNIEPTIELDERNSWADIFASFIRILQWLAVTLAGTILGAMALMIIFSARASLYMHGRTVNLLHAMGAEDTYIARQFQIEHFKIGLSAASIGVACAAAGYYALGFAVASIDTPVLPRFQFIATHGWLVMLMPFLCACIVLLATRFSVLVQLRKVL